MLSTGLATARMLFNQIRVDLEDDTHMPGLDDFLRALTACQFRFEKEHWHDVRACLRDEAPVSVPGEFLLRARDANGRPIPQEAFIRKIAGAGLSAQFDTAIALSAMHQAIAEKAFPVSINVSAHQASDPVFWTTLHKTLQHFYAFQYDPRDITFEFTEDGTSDNPAHDALTHMRGVLGYHFAIDDLSHTDMRRLHNLAPYIDTVKIDGKTIKAAECKTVSLGRMMEEIRIVAPHAEILAEWADSATVANDLHQAHNIRYVSGMHLPDPERFGQDVRKAWSESQPGALSPR